MHESENNKQGSSWRDRETAPFIRIEKVSKQFGDFTAVDSVDLDIYQGELFTILGASGSGKTTLLRILAGFETPSSGRVIIDDTDMTHVPPYERPVNMMFQSYAVFPHMTVEKNVAYGLKKEGIARAEIAGQVEEMLSLVQLSDFGKRKPRELSGGQLQRVALARALIKRPKVLLLDEPLAALDKKLREETQFELMNIQDELGITFIVVTHDQEEAMTLSTRIAVMNEGRFVQTGTPTEVYEYPNNRFVAHFFGTINMFEGKVVSIDEIAMLIETANCGVIKALPSAGLSERESVLVAVRPEKISISKEPVESDGVTCVKGTIWDLGYYGNYSIYRVRTGSDTYIQVSAQNQFRTSEHTLDWEDEVYVSWDLNSNIVLKA